VQSRPVIMVSLACAGFALLSACSGTTGGQAVAPPPAPSSSAGSLPYAGAPAVDTPLNTSTVDPDPCKAVSAAEIESLAGIGFESAQAQTVGSQDKQCGWNLKDGLGLLSGGVVRLGGGLSPLYERHAQGKLTVFEVLPPIQGFPAVVASNRPSSEGFCTVVVGISNEATYTAPISLDTRNPRYSDPCSVATKLATVAVKHLKGA
jgi:hypothetical protein